MCELRAAVGYVQFKRMAGIQPKPVDQADRRRPCRYTLIVAVSDQLMSCGMCKLFADREEPSASRRHWLTKGFATARYTTRHSGSPYLRVQDYVMNKGVRMPGYPGLLVLQRSRGIQQDMCPPWTRTGDHHQIVSERPCRCCRRTQGGCGITDERMSEVASVSALAASLGRKEEHGRVCGWPDGQRPPLRG